jgi:hypothetical protein
MFLNSIYEYIYTLRNKKHESAYMYFLVKSSENCCLIGAGAFIGFFSINAFAAEINK